MFTLWKSIARRVGVEVAGAGSSSRPRSRPSTRPAAADLLGDRDQLPQRLLALLQVALLGQERLQQRELVLAELHVALEVRDRLVGQDLDPDDHPADEQRERDREHPPVAGLADALQRLRQEVDVNQAPSPPGARGRAAPRTRRPSLQVGAVEAVRVDRDGQPGSPSSTRTPSVSPMASGRPRRFAPPPVTSMRLMVASPVCTRKNSRLRRISVVSSMSTGRSAS
jgi:hypothetical protein